MFLLPIPSRRISNGEALIKDVKAAVCGAEDRVLAVGYDIPEKMSKDLSSLGAWVIDVSLDESFLLDNARLTAIGAVEILLQVFDAAPCDLLIGIIGYGRIGKALLGALVPLFASPVVFTANESARLELGVSGIRTAAYDELRDSEVLGELGHFDVIFNTAPAPLVGSKAADALRETKILELASGDNFPDNVDVMRLPSLPARKYPISAGRSLARAVLKMMGEKL